MTTVSPLTAIKLALAQKWEEAIAANEELLVTIPDDLDTLKRIAYAYLKLGNITRAKRFYKKVLAIDKNNPVALKTLKRIEGGALPDKHTNGGITSPTMFLEEPGRTKIVQLVKLAPSKILFCVTPAQIVHLVAKKYTIEVRDDNKKYLGALPDDIAHRLIKLIAGGNEYEVYIKHVEKNELSVFMRETKRSKKLMNMPSFNVNSLSSYNPYIQEGLLRQDAVDTESTEDQDQES